VPWPSVRFAVAGGAVKRPPLPQPRPTATVAAAAVVAVICVWARTCPATAVAAAAVAVGGTTDGGAAGGPCACRPSLKRRKSRPTTATAVAVTRSTGARRTIRWTA